MARDKIHKRVRKDRERLAKLREAAAAFDTKEEVVARLVSAARRYGVHEFTIRHALVAVDAYERMSKLTAILVPIIPAPAILRLVAGKPRLALGNTDRTHCNQPDRDVATTICGYPLPCPWHTAEIRASTGNATVPPRTPATKRARVRDLAALIGKRKRVLH